MSADEVFPRQVSSTRRLLVVVHCYRAAPDIIRLISARKATTTERERYAERWHR